MSRFALGIAAAAALGLVGPATLTAVPGEPIIGTMARPGARVVLDAHNAYPYIGQFADRLERALAGGVPVAIEQDLVWRPAGSGLPARSIVSHGEPFDDREPSLKEHFFERIRPVVERALSEGDRTHWPLVTLNLDLKTNEPEHHRALWDLLGEYEAWLTTAVRTDDAATTAPLDVKPVLVLTGESEAQRKAFHDDLPIGARLRLFGAMPIRPRSVGEAERAAEQSRFWNALPAMALPKATNYRRWWNAPWSVVEAGGQREAGEWTADEETRLATLVRRAHEAGLWVRLWTVNGHPVGDETAMGWSAGYNVGSLAAARSRWRAAIAAGVDFVATDQYEQFSAELPAERPRFVVSRDIVIAGELTAADRLTWVERPFEVPSGTARIDVDTSYTDRDRGTAIEFGLYDPKRFRGASRTSKSSFFVTVTTATPSYHPGPLAPGTWRLLMGVPSIRNGVTSRYRVVVRVTPEGPGQPSPTAVPADRALTGPHWYQGDLHAHTMHSDGFSCASDRGNTAPCAAHQIADVAARRGLDFVAVTDHNTTSHHHGLVEVQARHPELLILRGQEVTTFHGHANVFGTSDIIDFRIGRPEVTAAAVFRRARQLGALVSINHPGRQTGERCTGCGWDAPDTDYSVVDALEVVNGGNVSGPTAGEPVWHARLNEGYRLTGIGGGDDHGAGTRAGSAIGTPTTVIHADALSEAALLAGIRAGRVYIKTRGPQGPDLRFDVPSHGVSMGGVLRVASPTSVAFRARVIGGAGQRADVVRNGRVHGLGPETLGSNDETLTVTLNVSPGDWVRINVRDTEGITAMGNPIYVR
jgi:hypothetical protein